MTVINIGDSISLKDKTGLLLGELTIQEHRCEAWCGPFIATSDYARVRELFLEWTRLVDDQCFRLVDTLVEKIRTLGILVYRGSHDLQACELQIYDHGDQVKCCFRLIA